jgi:hypothetical protein
MQSITAEEIDLFHFFPSIATPEPVCLLGRGTLQTLEVFETLYRQNLGIVVAGLPANSEKPLQ